MSRRTVVSTSVLVALALIPTRPAVANAQAISVGLAPGVSLRQEAAGTYSALPWLALHSGLELNRWVRVAVGYGLSYGEAGRRFSATSWQHRLSLVPELTIDVGGPRAFIGIGAVGELRVVTFRSQGTAFASVVKPLAGAAASAGLEVALEELRLRVRFSAGPALFEGRVDWLFTVAVERLFAGAVQ